MKKIILLALSLFLMNDAFAATKVSDHQVKALIAKAKEAKSQRAMKISKLSEPLIRTWMTPGTQPKQGEAISFFAQPNSTFADSDVIIEATLDSVTLPLQHPIDTLWLADAGVVTEIKDHDFVATLFIQDKAQAQQYRDAISSLEADIANLNSQIAAATDPAVISQLTAQRDEKVALKNQLVASLAELKTSVGSETIHYSVVSQTGGSEYPRIINVSPHLTKAAAGGTTLTISGVNFGANPQVILGDITTAVNSSNATTITLTTPVLSEGEKDVEVKFIENGVTKNAIRKNAFFATNDIVTANYPPVAVADAVVSPIVLGSPAQVTGVRSFDPNYDTFNYAWRLISKPALSTLPLDAIGVPAGTAITYSVMPDVPGYYVLELIVSKNVVPSLVSAPSLVVVQVTEPANRAPSGTAPPITVSKNFSKTSQITASDPDFWQQRTFLVTKQSAFGSATVSSAGLVSFTAGAIPGVDTMEISVVDNGTPQLIGIVSIPVTVLNNQPPVIQSTPAAFQRTEGAPYQVRFGLYGIGSGGVTDPDGTIQSLVWDFGDGTHEKIFDYAAASVFHNYMAPGTYTVTLTATDNNGATASVSGQAIVRSGAVPNAKFKYDVRAGAAPLTVTFDASAASGPSGIAQYRWFIAGQPAEIATTNPVFTWTFTTPGTYGVRLRTRETATKTGGEGESGVNEFVGGTDPGSFGYSVPMIGPPRMVTLGTPTTFDGSNSFTAAPGHDLATYNWTFGDFGASANGINVSYTYPDARNFFPGLQTFTDTGGFNGRVFQETWAVHAGAPPRAIARFNRTSGPAPLTITVDGSESYDYDGSIPETGYHWAFGDGAFIDGPVLTHVYTVPGVYNIGLAVNDSDNNTTQVNTTVTVTASADPVTKSEKPIKKLDFPGDTDREYQRQVLAGACYSGEQGDACYQLGQMFAEDGDEFTKTKLWEKACGLGYTDACQK